MISSSRSGRTRITVLPRPLHSLSGRYETGADGCAEGGAPEPPCAVLTVFGRGQVRDLPLAMADLRRGIILGRDTRCDIASDLFPHAATVSRVHAMLVAQGDRIYAIDLGSTHGTMVDGRPVVGVMLPASAEIHLGGGNRLGWRDLRNA